MGLCHQQQSRMVLHGISRFFINDRFMPLVPSYETISNGYFIRPLPDFPVLSIALYTPVVHLPFFTERE
jgi:hypothetical protein